MNQQKTKKLNNHQRLITAIALIVVALLAICVTFAWYTNRITIMSGKFQLGMFDYTVTLYDVDLSGANPTATSLKEQTYRKTASDTWNLNSPNEVGVASNSVKYQIVKVKNDSAFDIKAYEYLTYGTMDANTTALANYFYFRPYTLTIPSGTSLDSFLSTYSFPNAESISAPSSEKTFGTIQDNAVVLDKNGVEAGDTQYYLLAYCCKSIPGTSLDSTVQVKVNPVITIAQANGPVPQTSGTAKPVYAGNWQEFRNAILDANDGDTVYLTSNVESPSNTNLTIENGVNLHLNGKTLKIHGDLKVEYQTASARSITVPASSELYVDGNMYIYTNGPFSVNGAGSSENVFLGTYTETSGGVYRVNGGHFYTHTGLVVTEGSEIDDAVINENSGLMINNIKIMHMAPVENSTPDYAPAVITVDQANTMVKIGAGGAVGSIEAESGRGVSCLYIANYGEIEQLNLGSVTYPTYPSDRLYKVGLYVKNYNTIGTDSTDDVDLPSGAIGHKTGSSSTYNTRFINADGCATSFRAQIDNSGTSFKTQDVEPFVTSEVENSEVVRNGEGDFTVYLRNVPNNTNGNAELLSELFPKDSNDPADDWKTWNYPVASCSKLKIITTNGIKLSADHFEDIRDNFSALTKLDLSSAAIENITIPNNAFNVTLTGAQATGLSELVLPVTSIKIGENAFKGTRITQLTLSSNVKQLGTSAFDMANGVEIEVKWDNTNDITSEVLAAFDMTQTTFFMDELRLQNAIDNVSFTAAQKLNMYENYDFIDGDYYCKEYREESSSENACEIVYFKGTIASKNGQKLVPEYLSDGFASLDIVGIRPQAFKKAIVNNTATAASVILDLSDCITVADSAFAGDSAHTLKVSSLQLGKVNSIGNYAFEYATIELCEDRPNTFHGMESLGEYVFKDAEISEGVLDLHGTTDKYTPSDYALSGLEIYGSHTGAYAGFNTGNAILDVRNIDNIPGNFASGMDCSADVLASNCGTITAGAFAGAISGTGIVDVRDVKTIETAVFSGIQCNTLYLGTTNNSLIDNRYPYTSIVSSTSGTGIGTLVLDGKFATGNAPAIAGTSGPSVNIGTLRITANVTEIPKYTFATNATRPGVGNNLVIGALTVDSGASYTIGNDAFRGVNFSADASYCYNFTGVVSIGEEAFAYSTIRYLGLGEDISYIANENFIYYCDNITRLQIDVDPSDAQIDPDTNEYDYSDYIVTLGGDDDAEPAFTSSGAERDDFLIAVDSRLITEYVKASVWKGWKNYFGALSYTFVCSPYGTHTAESSEGVPSTAFPNIIRWTYNIIDPNDTSKGAKIIKCDLVTGRFKDRNGNTHNLVSLPLYGTSTTYKQVSVPPQVPYGDDMVNVTELGEEADLFEDLPVDNTNGYGVLDPDDPEHTNESEVVSASKFRLNLGGIRNSARVIDGKSLRSEKIDYLVMSAAGTYYYLNSTSKVLFQKQVSNYTTGANAYNEIVRVPTSQTYSGNTFTIPKEVLVIQKGAFEGCNNITKVVVQAGTSDTDYAKLSYIDEDAFKDSSIVTFDFRNVTKQIVSIAQDVYGTARKKTVTSSGYYQYEKATNAKIHVPSSLLTRYQASGMYALYSYYGCLTTDAPTASVSGANNAVQEKSLRSRLSLQEKQSDVCIGGVDYHLMQSGTKFYDEEYSSQTSEFVAVVTGLEGETASAKTVTIPESVVIKGVAYEVVGIFDGAFGINDNIETLVLPNKNVHYSSDSFAGCVNLGIIQYNNVIAYTQQVQTVADLPAASATALLGDSKKEESEN